MAAHALTFLEAVKARLGSEATKAFLAEEVKKAVDAVKAVEAAKVEDRYENKHKHLKATTVAGIPELSSEDRQAVFEIVLNWLLNVATEAFYTVLADGNGKVEIDCKPLASELATRTITINGINRPMGMFRAWHAIQHIVLGRTPGFCSNDTLPHLEEKVDFAGIDMRLPVSTPAWGKVFSAMPYVGRAVKTVMDELLPKEMQPAFYVGLTGTAELPMEQPERVEFFDRTLSIMLCTGEAALVARKAAEKWHWKPKAAASGGARAARTAPKQARQATPHTLGRAAGISGKPVKAAASGGACAGAGGGR